MLTELYSIQFYWRYLYTINCQYLRKEANVYHLISLNMKNNLQLEIYSTFINKDCLRKGLPVCKQQLFKEIDHTFMKAGNFQFSAEAINW